MKSSLSKLTLLISTLALGMITGCKPKQIAVGKNITIRQKLLPVVIAQDTAQIIFKIDYDSIKGITIRDYRTYTTSGVQTLFEQDSNTIRIAFETIKDTAYLAITDTTIWEQVPVIVPTKKTTSPIVDVLKLIALIVLPLVVLSFIKLFKR